MIQKSIFKSQVVVVKFRFYGRQNRALLYIKKTTDDGNNGTIAVVNLSINKHKCLVSSYTPTKTVNSDFEHLDILLSKVDKYEEIHNVEI